MAILSDEEIREAIAGRREWRRSGDTLVRERSLRDFGEALAFLERIGQAAEDYGRHPDMAITGGNRVRVVVSNPNGAGITDAEVRLVAKVDEVADAPEPEPEPEPQPEGARATLAAVASSASSTVTESASAAVEAVASSASSASSAVADSASAAVEAIERPVHAVATRTSRGALIAAAAGGLAVGAAAVLASRRR